MMNCCPKCGTPWHQHGTVCPTRPLPFATTDNTRNWNDERVAMLEGLLREALAWLHDDAGVKRRIRAALGER